MVVTVASSVPAPGRTDGINVLYVDDEHPVRNAFRRTLKSAGIPVTVMGSPNEALEHLASSPDRYSVIAADYQMGSDMDGATFLARVAQISASASRILVSGQFDVDRLFDAVNTGGIYQVVSKPWDAGVLIPLLVRAGEHSRLARENKLLLEKLEIQNAQLKRNNAELDALVIQRTHFLLDGLVSALDLRDSETQWHSRRVSAYARMLGAALGVEDSALVDVEYGALLHDVGKIGINDSILLKPGRLTDEEWAVMKTHPRLGFELLSEIDFLRGAAMIVYQHHEKFDGGGYPHRLRGEEIVLGARIFAVIDAFDAITTNRPYKPALPFGWAREEIARCTNSHFDPHVVEAFLSIEDDDWRKIQTRHSVVPPPG